MSTARYIFPPFTLDAARRRLYRGTELVPLTPKAIELLLALIERPRAVVDKDDLMERLWPGVAVEEANLSQQIFTLRKTLGERAGESRFIATVPRRGYRFLADVQMEATDPIAAAPPDGPLRLALPLPPEAAALRLAVPSLALAPNGTELLYVGVGEGGQRLYRRPAADLAVYAIAGTSGASCPFWHPDGSWFGFVADGLIKRMQRSGGPAFAIAEAPQCRGATWLRTGQIVFAPGPAEGLWIVADDGGPARPLTTVDFAAGERSHRWPAAFDDGILFTIAAAGIRSFDDASLAYVAVDTGARHAVLARASDGRPLPNGAVTFLRDGALWATRLDRTGAKAIPVHVLEHVAVESTGIAHFSATSERLVHMPGGRQRVERMLVWTDGRGGDEPINAPDGEIEEPRLSPDATRIAIGVRSGTSDLWICDATRQVFSRLTSTHDNFAAVWTPDGEHLTFSSNRLGPTNIFSRRADGSPAEQLVVGGEFDLVPGSWSADGRELLFTEYHPESGADIWVVRRGTAPELVLRTPFNEYSPAWHPGGDWFAYTSDETGEPQVYVRRLATGSCVRVSPAGGSEPVWSRDGRRLFYRCAGAIVRADIEVTADRCTPSAPRIWLDMAGEPGTPTGLPNYDIGAGDRAVVVRSHTGVTSITSLIATVRWTAGLNPARDRDTQRDDGSLR